MWVKSQFNIIIFTVISTFTAVEFINALFQSAVVETNSSLIIATLIYMPIVRAPDAPLSPLVPPECQMC